MNFLYFLFVLSVGFLVGNPAGRANVLDEGILSRTDSLTVIQLPLPEVPGTLHTVPERAAYVLEHFWDALDFSDTLYSRHCIFMEQNFVNFVSLFPHASREARVVAVKRLMKAAEADSVVYSLLASLAEKYLYEPESPMVCEDCFLLFLEEIVCSSVWNGYTRMRSAYLLEIVKKNRPGTQAADFSFLLPDGRSHLLYQIPGRYLLLVFYDTGCDHCHEVMSALKEDILLRRLTEAGELTLLIVDTGLSYTAWQHALLTWPPEWKTAFDKGGMQAHDRYVWRNLPALYLLDRDKTVLLKEASVQSITTFLTSIWGSDAFPQDK